MCVFSTWIERERMKCVEHQISEWYFIIDYEDALQSVALGCVNNPCKWFECEWIPKSMPSISGFDSIIFFFSDLNASFRTFQIKHKIKLNKNGKFLCAGTLWPRQERERETAQTDKDVHAHRQTWSRTKNLLKWKVKMNVLNQSGLEQSKTKLNKTKKNKNTNRTSERDTHTHSRIEERKRKRDQDRRQSETEKTNIVYTKCSIFLFWCVKQFPFWKVILLIIRAEIDDYYAMVTNN